MKKCPPNRFEKTTQIGLELLPVKVSRSAGVMWVSSADPAVIKLLLEENGRKK